jgi:hypothetical protein
MDGKASSVGWWVLVAGAVFLTLGVPAQAQYGGGSGTVEDPYLIGTAEQMNAVGLNPEDSDKHFRLVADIDLKDLGSSTFHPVAAFQGVFDGNGHTIANLTLIITGDEDPCVAEAVMGVGLFRSIKGPDAEVKDLGLLNPDVRPASTCPKRVWFVGALAGQLSLGTIRNCYVEGGQVLGDRVVGGLVGESTGTVSDCHATCTVQPAGERPLPEVARQFGHPESFGGLVGETYGAVSNCWSAGDVLGDSSVGGLVGTCHRPTRISRCYSKGRVSGQLDVGGLVGVCSKKSSIADCFALGSAFAQRQAGGVVGCHEGSILRSYSTASVSVTGDYAGGLVGLNGGTIGASWAGGTVAGGSGIGGLIGFNVWDDQFLQYNPVVTDCYARGNVHGENQVGGLIGFNQKGTVLRCYSTGPVTGETTDSVVSGLAGTSDATLVQNSFWDMETSGVSESTAGTGKTTAEMQNLWTYIVAGWDFVGEASNGTEDIWKMCCGRPIYPKLAWEPLLAGDFVDPEGVDFRDLAFLAEHWLETTPLPCGSPDLNFDARVDMKDLALLAQSWQHGARRVIFETALDVSPGWTMEGQWQFGTPAGRGGTQHGNPDPVGGYTGDNVYGVNLDGDYAVTADGPHYLTAGPFDGRPYHDVRLQFARRLNTDEADYVHATLEVSTDGTTWAIVWRYENAEAVLADDAWRVVVYNLGLMADHQESIYIRWGYEIKDEKAWPMSGWNLDDVILTGAAE